MLTKGSAIASIILLFASGCAHVQTNLPLTTVSELLRDPQRFDGQRVHVTGQLLVSSSLGELSLLSPHTKYERVIWVTIDPAARHGYPFRRVAHAERATTPLFLTRGINMETVRIKILDIEAVGVFHASVPSRVMTDGLVGEKIATPFQSFLYELDISSVLWSREDMAN